MKRRTFIKTSLLGSGLLLLKPGMLFSQEIDPFSKDDLLGKGNPVLYGKNYKLRREAYLQFDLMRNSATIDGFKIHVVSSYRNYAHQNRIWERKYNNFTKQGLTPEKAIQKIIKYSTIPGTSRHHWGTDLDIIDTTKGYPNNPLSETHFNEGGRMRKFKLWLDENAEKFGFYLVYTNQPKRKGFAYEPWHFSYKPLSLQMLNQYRKLDIKKVLQENNLLGSKYFTDDFIAQYTKENILDINPDLLA